MYGIEFNKQVPNQKENYPVGNHIRAILDMIYNLDFNHAKGMKNDYIVTDEYNDEIFKKVYILKNLPTWNKIDKFMETEYKMIWLNYKKTRKDDLINSNKLASSYLQAYEKLKYSTRNG